MTEEIRYIANLQRQEEFDNEVTELKDELKRLEQERDEWKKKYEDAANENLKEIYELIKKNDCWRGVVNVVCSKLEQENKDLKKEIAELRKDCNHCNFHTYRSALEEIRKKCNWVKECSVTNDNLWEYDEILEIINEVLK
jgi:predicted  nucleic acid-binding Zn-ribbon protein